MVEEIHVGDQTWALVYPFLMHHIISGFCSDFLESRK